MGAVRRDSSTGGRWSTLEQQAHINVLELKAAFFGLRSLCTHDKDVHIQLQLDNTTAVAYLNKMGGTQSRPLNDLAYEIWQWCIERNIWLSAVHIPGKVNVEADKMSRVFHDNNEWKLNTKMFQKIFDQFPNLEIDLFASRINFQLDQYVAWRPDPGCIAVDAFAQNWETKMFYAFPLFSLVPRCLQKITQDQATGILIAPFWPTQAWFPQLLQMLYDQPWILAPSATLLQHPVQLTPHPLAKTLRLMVCPVSGIVSKQKTFQKTLQISSFHLGEQVPRNNIPLTLKDGWTFVVKERLLVIHQHSVDHEILLAKLKTYGISGNLYNWFSNYLRGRTQRVIVDGVASEWSTVPSGVPQGSILGPMLFLLFINDLPDAIPPTTSTGLYADDTKLYKAITSNEDCTHLQTALSCAEDWSNKSNINFNSSKCKVLTISRRRRPITTNYHLGSTDLKRVDSEVDLGITVTSNLCWNTHITQIVNKSNKMLGLLRRTCPLLTDCDVRRTLYLSLVKSQLCYATEVWSPSQCNNKIKLERIQRRATR